MPQERILQVHQLLQACRRAVDSHGWTQQRRQPHAGLPFRRQLGSSLPNSVKWAGVIVQTDPL